MQYSVKLKTLKLYELDCPNCFRCYRVSKNENGDYELIESQSVLTSSGRYVSVWGRSSRYVGQLVIRCKCGVELALNDKTERSEIGQL